MSKIERKFNGDRILRELLSSFIEKKLDSYLMENVEQVKSEANYGHN